jgi:hypothetical protein
MGKIKDFISGLGKVKPEEQQVDAQIPKSSGAFGVPVVSASNFAKKKKYETYREMDKQPTIALSEAIVKAPILGAEVAITSEDESIKEFLDDNVMCLWEQYSRDALRMLSMGYSGWEKVFQPSDGKIIVDLKYLLPDMTDILTGDKGEFIGLKQKDVILEREKSMIITNQKEGDNYYGVSRHENIEKQYNDWKDTNQRLADYQTNSSKIIPTMHYPTGKSKKRTGDLEENHILAARAAKHMANGNPVILPNQINPAFESMLRSGQLGNPKDYMAWRIDFIEMSGGKGEDYLGTLRYYDSLFARGWLVPERTMLEGQHGTKAEAQSHGDWSLIISEEILNIIIETFQNEVIDVIVALNFGLDKVGTATLESIGVSNEKLAFMRQILTTVLGNPINTDVLIEMFDVATMGATAGLPENKNSDGITIVRSSDLDNNGMVNGG